jgi:hypothetical protein
MVETAMLNLPLSVSHGTQFLDYSRFVLCAVLLDHSNVHF